MTPISPPVPSGEDSKGTVQVGFPDGIVVGGKVEVDSSLGVVLCPGRHIGMPVVPSVKTCKVSSYGYTLKRVYPLNIGYQDRTPDSTRT